MTQSYPIQDHLLHLDRLLDQYRDVLGADFQPYRNHCYRVFHYCAALTEPNPLAAEAIQIALAFHDLGLWTHHTLDYLPPSQALAAAYVAEFAPYVAEFPIDAMIADHHKITATAQSNHAQGALVEAFRQADLVDVSWGVVSSGLSKPWIKHVQQQFPNLGFHRCLLRFALSNLRKHPLKPAPMIKW